MRRTRRTKLAPAVAIAVATLLGALSAPAQTPPRSVDPARMASDQVAALAQQLSELETPQDARDAAARRLLTIGRDEARNAVAAALGDPANPGARLAAARAVADDLPPDPAFVDPLFRLLETDQPRALIDAAAVALGNYKSMPEVSRRLVGQTVAARSEPVRLAAIRALSAQIEKSAGEALVRLTTDANPTIAAAAIEALQGLASMPLATAGDWADWWKTQADHPEDRFRMEMLGARAVRFEQQARRGDDTYQELRQGVVARLNATPRDQLPDELGRLFASPRDAVRLIAVRHAQSLATTGDLPTASRPGVRGLLADPSAEVRMEAARTVLSLPGDGDTAAALARQIVVESDARVRDQLAGVLADKADADSVNVLASLLEDTSPRVVQAAAKGLSRLGESFARESPAAAADLADRVQGILQARGKSLTSGMREQLIEVLVYLGQRSMRPMYRQMLTGNASREPEPEPIRRLAARGLGALKDSANVDLLVESLGDPSADVRKSIVEALGESAKAKDGFSLIERSLYRRLDPKEEPDAGVRAAAWTVATKLFDGAPRAQLAAWLEGNALRDDNAKRFELHMALAKKFRDAGDADGQSAALQQAGDSQRAIAEAAETAGDAAASVARYADAVRLYREALAISRSTRQGMVVNGLVTSIMQSTLRGRDYPGAAKFASELFAAPDGREYQRDVAYQFSTEAQSLSKRTDRQEDALRLVAAASGIANSFPDNYREQLENVRRDVLARRQTQQRRDDLIGVDPRIGLALAR